MMEKRITKQLEIIFDKIDALSDSEFDKELEKHKDGDIALIFIEIWEFGNKYKHMWE
jgi:hypothetical protein